MTDSLRRATEQLCPTTGLTKELRHFCTSWWDQHVLAASIVADFPVVHDETSIRRDDAWASSTVVWEATRGRLA